MVIDHMCIQSKRSHVSQQHHTSPCPDSQPSDDTYLFSHFAFNMISIYSAVPPLIRVMGSSSKFMGFYLLAGLVTSAGSLTWHAYVSPALGHQPFSASHGASGEWEWEWE